MARTSRTYILDTVADADVIKFLETKPNKSQYVIELIRKDMKNETALSEEQRNEVIELIKKYAGSLTISSEEEESHPKLPKKTPELMGAFGQFLGGD